MEGSADRRPLIGITTSPLRPADYYLTYARAVAEAGAQPLLVAPGDSVDVQALDGLLLPGGWDVQPQLYGAEPDPRTGQVDPALDELEIGLAREVRQRQRPVLGICRGMQVINVAFQGTLMQHVDGHEVREHGRKFLAHAVEVIPGSELAAAAGSDRIEVNSLHHQVVEELAPGFRASARDEEGVVEGMESEDGLVVAVQCHPEELVGDLAWARRLFRRFVERAGR